jgi:FHA domain
VNALGLHIDHRNLAIFCADRASVAPLAVNHGDASPAVGSAAMGRARIEPDQVSLDHWAALADAERARTVARWCAREVRERLSEYSDGAFGPVAVAVPVDYGAAALANLAAVLGAAGITDAAFVDSSVAMAAVAGHEHGVVALEVGWQQATVSRVGRSDAFARQFAMVDAGLGVEAPYRRWMDVIAAAMVKQTRFDPLHDRRNEQALFDALPRLLATAAREGMVRVELPGEAAAFPVEVPAQALTDAASTYYRRLLRFLLGSEVAGESRPMLLPDELRAWPGFEQRLLAGTELPVRWVPAGFVARIAAQLAPRLPARSATWRCPELTTEPWHRELITGAEMRPRAARSLAVTHALYGGESMRLLDAPLVIGRNPETAGPVIRIAETVAGVSRRHCSILRESGATFVIDHSRCGTWLNGVRVVERARVQPGDRLRVGIPGVDVTLISATAADGAPAT